MKLTKMLADARSYTALLIVAVALAISALSAATVFAADDDLEITGLRWSGDTEARWDKNSNCYKYEVKLYRDSSSRTTKTTTDNYYDFDSYMNSKGDYHFEVRGAGQDGEYGEWYSSEYIYLSSDDVRDNRDSHGGAWDSNHGPGVSGTVYYYDPYTGYYYTYPTTSTYYNSSYYGAGIVREGEGIVTYGNPYGTYNSGIYTSQWNYWVQDAYGWRFHMGDGSYPANCWLEIDGLYYCFDENGYMRHDCWIFYNGSQYYVGSDGALMANCYTPDGHYVGSDGAMIF